MIVVSLEILAHILANHARIVEGCGSDRYFLKNM